MATEKKTDVINTSKRAATAGVDQNLRAAQDRVRRAIAGTPGREPAAKRGKMQETLEIPKRVQVAMKPTDQDERILARLRQKLGVSDSDLFRMGIRLLAGKEEVSIQ